VYSFDEGMASRVPYESAARVLTQTKSSQSGYAIRQGLAIAMEHNFLASDAGRTNFKHQLTQLVGSIQLTNDLDVHIALLQAQSYERVVSEKYYGTERTLARTGKQYCDMFGVYNKITNALDLLIEEARTKLKTWGSEPPTFLLCPSNLTLHLTMSPERTNYITNGPDGMKRLAAGPDLPSYRGLSIIHSQKFALEAGREPRNVLRRKVRVAEHYWLPHDEGKSGELQYEFYDQSSDSFKNFTKAELIKKSGVESWMKRTWTETVGAEMDNREMFEFDFKKCDVLVLRPNIEHEMLSVIIGRGGTQELGSTYWGQTELACYDDAQHGIWGMSYKYHQRAIVTNTRNLVRLFDVAFDGYNGGMGCDIMQWDTDGINEFRRDTESLDGPYRGKSMVVLAFPTMRAKERYLSHKILERRRAGGDEDGPGPEDPAVDNPRLDLERVLRKVAYANPLFWNRSERLLETILTSYDVAFRALRKCMDVEYVDGGWVFGDYGAWAAHPLAVMGTDYVGRLETESQAYNVATVGGFVDVVAQINHLHGIGLRQFADHKTLFLWCIAKLVVVYMLQNTSAESSAQFVRYVTANTALDALVAVAGAVDYAGVLEQANTLRTLTNINCVDLLESLYCSGRDGYWDWFDYFHDVQRHTVDNATPEMPNPLVLPRMFSPTSQPAVFVDSESTVPIADSMKYDLSQFLGRHMSRNSFAGHNVGNAAYKTYMEHLESMFTAQVNISPGENIRANTTQIPTLCYHGNMKTKQAGMLLDEVKCTGHMGNSYPGMASVREGRGSQSMNATSQIVHLQ
jgi:hypothetical protein